jgi:hypothetical protein
MIGRRMRMGRAVLLLTMMFTLLLVGGIGTVAAEPQKNQIEVPVKCDNGEKYTFVINGEGNAGQITDSTSKIIITSYTITYITEGGERIVDTFDQGNANELQGDLITCTGRITVELFGLGEVRAIFEFQAFVTPRSD